MESNTSGKSNVFETKLRCSNMDIKTVYSFHEILGGGQFGTVRVGQRKNGNQIKKYAIKTITKKKLSSRDIQNLTNEVQILSSLDHPNIIKLEEAYQDQFYLHIVTELCEGKDVLQQCHYKDNLSENNVCLLIFKLVVAVKYLHELGICHRDIKTDNIMFATKDFKSDIKLLDFGLSKRFKPGDKMKEKTGTPFYICPEIIIGEYDEKCDMWSIGVMTYLLISGMLPYYTESDKVPQTKGKKDKTKNKEVDAELFQKILKEKPSYTDKVWSTCSKKAIDFVQKCLEKNPKNRLSCTDAVKHPWFKNILSELQSQVYINKTILNNLVDFYNKSNSLERIVKRHLTNLFSDTELQKLNLSFYALNIKLNGTIDLEELEFGFQFCKIRADVFSLEEAMKKAGGKICYSDFLASNVCLKKYNNKVIINEVFKYFDSDSNGYLDEKDLDSYYLRRGKKINDINTLKSIITESCEALKLSDKNKINFDGFSKIFEEPF
ncbi:MAG: serine/threonine-protein kinase [archaeon]|nr:serine/threonine-protein kinase [archaeon]